MKSHEDEELLTPPKTECSRITPGPLRFLPSDFTLEGGTPINLNLIR